MSAASQGLANNSAQRKVDNDIPVLNLATQLAAVPRNAAWEANARGSNSNPSPSQKPRTATESEDIRRGKQTDRSVRDTHLQNIPRLILQNNQIQDILDDYYIDEEQVVDENEHYGEGRETKGEGELAEEDNNTQALTENGKGKKKKKKTLLQRVTSAFTKKLKTPEAG